MVIAVGSARVAGLVETATDALQLGWCDVAAALLAEGQRIAPGYEPIGMSWEELRRLAECDGGCRR